MEARGNLTHIGWPYSNGNRATEAEFYKLPKHTHRKVIRVFSVIQEQVFIMDRLAVGPFVWGVAVCSLMDGGKPFMTVLNKLGYCVSYFSMHRERLRIAKEEAFKSNNEKVVCGVLQKFAWDNIDARLAANVTRLLGNILDWHGTIFISEQMKSTRPIVTAQTFRKISLEHHPTAKHVVNAAVEDTLAVKMFNTMLAALIFVFRNHLISENPKKQVSLDFLLRLSLRGSSIGSPALISNLCLLDQPSNCSETALFILDQAAEITKQQPLKAGDEQEKIRYCVVVGDGPLDAQVRRILHDCHDGERNEAYKTILPLPGQFHQAMAFQDVLKFFCWDSVLDALEVGSGLSPTMIESFRSKKEYKTNLRLFRQSLVALWIRLFDVLFESAAILPSDPIFANFEFVQYPCKESTRDLRHVIDYIARIAEGKGPVTAEFEKRLHCNPQFFGYGMQKLGEYFLKTVEEKSSELGNVNFTFFTSEVMLELLGPSLCMYYSSRAGQLQARQAVVKHFTPYLFTTTKTTYEQSAVWKLEFDLTAPEDALNIIYGESGSYTNITGKSAFGNVEDDEALEMAGVKLTKAGATTSTFKSLSSSFYSCQKLMKVKRKMQQECHTIAEDDEGDEAYCNAKNFLADKYKSESKNVQTMLSIAGGATSVSGMAFLGDEQQSSPRLVNTLCDPPLYLTLEETDKVMNRRKLGLLAAADLFKRTVAPYRHPDDSRKGTRKNAIYGFAGARDAEKRKMKEGQRKKGKRDAPSL